MAVLPKPDDQRRRRNKPTTDKTHLPAEGHKAPPPTWPFPGSPPARWKLLWALPEAAMWGPSDVLVLARYTRSCLVFERMQGLALKSGELPTGMTSLQSEIRQTEANYGMNPAAKLRLRIELARDEVAEQREVTPRRRLKAVDTQAAGPPT